MATTIYITELGTVKKVGFRQIQLFDILVELR